MSSVLSYASFAIAIAAMVVASQSAVGEKHQPGTQAVVTNSSEPAIASAWVYYPSQFVNKARFVEREYPQF